jgi:hypothetical protein
MRERAAQKLSPKIGCMGAEDPPRAFRAASLTAVFVRLRLALAESDSQAVMTHDVLARRVLAHVANVDCLATLLALDVLRDHFGCIPSRTASVL